MPQHSQQKQVDIPGLIEHVKASKLLSAEEKKYWIKKMEEMKDEDLADLSRILEQAEGIDLETSVTTLEGEVEGLEQAYQQAQKDFSSLS